MVRAEEIRKAEDGREARQPGGLFYCWLRQQAAAVSGVFLRHLKVQEEERAKTRDSSEAVVTEYFPGDDRNEAAKDSAASEENLEGKTPMTVEEALQEMTLREKVLQLFMVTPEALTGVDEVYAAGAKTEESIREYPVGGIVYFKQNLRSPDQVKDMLTRTQKYFRDNTGIEAFLAVDEEGGQVSRISGREEFGIASFPDMSEIGASGEPQKAYEVGDKIGTYLADLGFNMDFAPVADVLTNPENTVVARRSFGTDGAVTAAFSNEVVKGLQAHGISAVLKHFPGHGGTTADSHDGYAATERTLEELMAEDFVPFLEGGRAGARFIMSGHIAAPAVTGDNTPASMSPKMITEILRGTLGYDGIIITDALNMGAVTSSYSSADAARQGIAGGE